MDLLTEKQVAERIGVTEEVLQQWRHRKQGPTFVKQGRWVRYLAEDVDAWILARRELTERAAIVHHEAKARVKSVRALNASRARACIPDGQRSENGRKGAAKRWAAK